MRSALRAELGLRGRASLVTRRRAAAFRPACQAGASTDWGKAAARTAVDRWVKPGSVVGIGTGEIVSHAVEYLAQQVASGKLPGVVAVPSCSTAASEAAFQGLAMSSLEQHPKVDVFIEQADQIDVAGNAFLKGIRAEPVQPDLIAFRALLAAADRVVVVADGGDAVSRLGASLPVAIVAEGWEEPAEELDDMFLGDAELWRRPSEGTANPRGGPNPFVSEDGAYTLVDVRFYEGFKLYGEDEQYSRIAEEIEGIPGVLAHGLVVGRACAAVVADGEAGAVTTTELGAAAAGDAAV
ncbi:ribose 5-phosphate isomerase A [Monoraphidium neglectum]|uniref:ribose-5-phosphate isomerase n=1 Tax=Monoraphidium neglectum TaxID=145388 RepID=A0A0D2K0S7_9CHLO|nr:ribose 5-phosphate isomerase A [Monoraphidium neglectum]KIZ04218.1 ribose 5-phosphate isomerase A [Monoraphidium neglectum]|eukprot:XP_013903237.1 ribose 5-phosphate isomerase A [Monoraphidium neglectum]